MAVYETAFDCVTTPASETDDDPIDGPLERSRQLCSPEPSQRPSPASSRSSRSSTYSGSRRHTRSPGLPLKKLFGQWVCGTDITPAESPIESPPTLPKEERKSDAFSPSVEFKKLDVAGEIKWNLNDIPNIHSESTSVRHSLNLNETIPTDILSKSRQVVNSHNAINQSNLNRFDILDNRLNLEMENSNTLEYPTESQLEQAKSSRDDMKRANAESNSGHRENLWLDFNRAPKRPRRHFCLDFAPPENENEMEPTAQLLKQGWYHGSISKADAENMLRVMKKGSFLVRSSEKLRRQYLLSLKSSLGVVHVKIVQSPNGKYVIKQQTQTFDSIPQLVQYFSTHILHIHEMNVYLSHPVIEKLL